MVSIKFRLQVTISPTQRHGAGRSLGQGHVLGMSQACSFGGSPDPVHNFPMSQDHGIDQSSGPHHGFDTSQGLGIGKGPGPDRGLGMSQAYNTGERPGRNYNLDTIQGHSILKRPDLGPYHVLLGIPDQSQYLAWLPVQHLQPDPGSVVWQTCFQCLKGVSVLCLGLCVLAIVCLNFCRFDFHI